MLLWSDFNFSEYNDVGNTGYLAYSDDNWTRTMSGTVFDSAIIQQITHIPSTLPKEKKKNPKDLRFDYLLEWFMLFLISMW